MIIAVDFDGTCVTHEYPNIGKPIGAAPVLKWLTDNGHQIILNTMRGDIHGDLKDAIDWFEKYNIPLFGVNENPTQREWTSSPKAYAHIYIDDAALGCPLIVDPSVSDRPFVHWGAVKRYLMDMFDGRTSVGYTMLQGVEKG